MQEARREVWQEVTAREVLDGIKDRLEAASPGPWEAVLGATADGSELATTREQKADFLAASLNDDGAPLWVVENGSVIPAVTGDGPRAGWNAAFIAAAPVDVARLTRAIEDVLGVVDTYPYSVMARDVRAAIEDALNPKEGQ